MSVRLLFFLIADLKDVTKDSALKRFRLIISDGVSRCVVMLSSQCNLMVTDGMLNKGALIEVNGMLKQNITTKP